VSRPRAHANVPGSGPEPGPLDSGSTALTMRPTLNVVLAFIFMVMITS